MGARAVVLALTCAACGPSSIGSCRAPAQGTCDDLFDADGEWTVADGQMECANTPGGVWSRGACDVRGALAGCETDATSAFGVDKVIDTMWYWPGSTAFGSKPRMTPADVSATCSPSGFELPDGTFPDRH